LSGAHAAVDAAGRALGGEAVPDDDAVAFWHGLREQRLPYFGGDEPLWRFAVPSATAMLDLPGAQLIEWNGGQRWWRGEWPAAELRNRAAAAGGHAALFRGGDKSAGVFQPLSPALMALHRRVKAAFDPRGVLNPGRFGPPLPASPRGEEPVCSLRLPITGCLGE
jgi:glycolate oxidase FAD binding subunit